MYEITTKNPFVDLHCHLQFDNFAEDRDSVIGEMKKNNVIGINVGVDEKSSRAGIVLAQENKGVLWSTIGLHPLYPEGVFDMENLLKDEKFNSSISGIGECGLDYFRITGDNLNEPDLDKVKDFQKEIFISQIKMSITYDLPLMLHVRDSYRETLEILKENFKSDVKEYRGNVHFFAGTIDEAQEFLNLGFSISFTGVITFVESYADLVRFVPIERMFAETDSPYVAPKSFRGQKNNPNHVREIYKKIAEIKEIDINDVIDIFYNNAKKHWIK
ncbi:TatD family hydrolase [Arenimonas sp.]|nr:TatD family hydrolase [Candidatus Parcubacteria bacterium]